MVKNLWSKWSECSYQIGNKIYYFEPKSYHVVHLLDKIRNIRSNLSNKCFSIGILICIFSFSSYSKISIVKRCGPLNRFNFKFALY